MNRLIAAATIAVAILVPQRVRAQGANNQISYAAIMKAPIGSWAEYLMTSDGMDATSTVRYILVERNAKQIVVELDSKTPAGRIFVRMEFAPAPKESTRWNLVRTKLIMSDGALRDLPVPAGSDTKSASFGKGDSFGAKLGREDVSVRAGTFSTDHYRRENAGFRTDVWMDDKVLPVGMVRLSDGKGAHVELVNTGKNGQSHF